LGHEVETSRSGDAAPEELLQPAYVVGPSRSSATALIVVSRLVTMPQTAPSVGPTRHCGKLNRSQVLGAVEALWRIAGSPERHGEYQPEHRHLWNRLEL
jgi:hypothetical protein